MLNDVSYDDVRMAYDMASALVYGMQKDARMIIYDMGFDMV